MQVTKTTQLITSMPDEVGQLAEVLSKVADVGVNILAYAGYVEDGRGVVMLVTEDNSKVVSVLSSAGLSVEERPVVVARDKDVVGEGATLGRKIADAGVNLLGAYATAAGGEYITVYWCGDTDALADALQ